MKTVALLGADGAGREALAQKLLSHFHLQALAGHWQVAKCGTLRGDVTLLLGLDPHQPAAEAAIARAEDGVLRRSLAVGGIDFQVVYGSGEERLANALHAIESVSGRGSVAAPPRAAQREWVWNCEKCSDPECEHKLFTRWSP